VEGDHQLKSVVNELANSSCMSEQKQIDEYSRGEIKDE
jgi:hypothetical protein